MYDPDQVSYEKLLDVFWKKHDPTTLNRQGGDRGTQYRSGIYYHSEEQREIATKSMQAAQVRVHVRLHRGSFELVKLKSFPRRPSI